MSEATISESERAAERAAGRRFVALGTLVILIAGTLAFWPVFRGDFSMWDDAGTIAENPALIPPTWAGLATRWTSPHLNIYIPLTHTMWAAIAMIAYQPTGRPLVPWPFKVASVAVHLLTSAVVFAIARRAGGPRWPALVGALLFCLHPLQVESVAWTSGMKDLLCGLFVATSIACYLRAAEAPLIGETVPERRWSTVWLVASLAAMVLGGLSKPTAMVLPAMLLAIDRLWLRRSLGESIKRLLPFAATALVIAVVAVAVQPAGFGATPAPLAWRPLIVGRAYAFYLAKLVVPTSLAFDYGLPWQRLVASSAILVAWLAPASLVAIAWLARRRWPALGVGVALAAIPLLPVTGAVWFDFAAFSLVADHYVYASMLGVAVAIAALPRVFDRSALAPLFAAAALIALGVVTFKQSRTWRDAESIARQTLAVNPQSYASLNHLGLLAARVGALDEAEAYQRRSLANHPKNPPALQTLGELALRRGDPDAALEWYRRAIAINPYSAKTHYAIAAIEFDRGEIGSAVRAMEEAIRVDPEPGSAAARQAQRAAADAQRRADRASTRAVPP